MIASQPPWRQPPGASPPGRGLAGRAWRGEGQGWGRPGRARPGVVGRCMECLTTSLYSFSMAPDKAFGLAVEDDLPAALSRLAKPPLLHCTLHTARYHTQTAPVYQASLWEIFKLYKGSHQKKCEKGLKNRFPSPTPLLIISSFAFHHRPHRHQHFESLDT